MQTLIWLIEPNFVYFNSMICQKQLYKKKEKFLLPQLLKFDFIKIRNSNTISKIEKE